MNMSDYFFAIQYLVNSLQLSGTYNVAKTTLALYVWLLVLIAFFAGCVIYICLIAEDFVETNNKWDLLFCALLENISTKD